MSRKILFILIFFIASLSLFVFFGTKSAEKNQGNQSTNQQSDFKVVSMDDLKKRFDNKDTDFVLVDVRSKREYDQKHIKGALSIPVEDIEKRAGELPKDKDIIIYCHGLKCNTSRIAAGKLKNLGFSADKLQLLDGNAPEWEKKGYQVEGTN